MSKEDRRNKQLERQRTDYARNPEKYKARAKAWQQAHAERCTNRVKKWQEAHPNYSRNRRLWLNGKLRTVEGKRPHPLDGCCEICGSFPRRCLQYHHWNDSNISKGIWVCFQCHRIIHVAEADQLSTLLEKYYSMKIELDKSE